LSKLATPMGGDSDAGWVLAVKLLLGSSALFTELHRRLADAGHPQLRPAHGFVFQTLGPSGATASEVAAKLGVTKQAARLVLAELAELGYIDYRSDPNDARRRPAHLTRRGREALSASAATFEQLREEVVDVTSAPAMRSALQVLGAIDARYGPAGLRPVW
jgi:DNA-binding MarR family transcriptional regulator